MSNVKESNFKRDLKGFNGHKTRLPAGRQGHEARFRGGVIW